MTTAADSLPDFTGCTVDDQYELVQILGSGTYGVVYKALDKHASTPDSPIYRAVKIIRKAGRSSSEIAAVHREVGLHAKVSPHAGVVSIIDAYDDNDYFYIILDYCPGGDLFEKIVTGHTYEGNDTLLKQAFISLVDAVQACHDAKISHRDLKPENILTSEDGSQLYLADFGMATHRRMIDDFGCGTAIYMSPECIGELYRYKPYCTRTSDVWALGVILINMLSGRNPWQKPTPTDPCFKRFLRDPAFLRDTLPISPGAHVLLRRVLALNPLRRISLPALRRAVLALDTFFRPAPDCEPVPEPENVAPPPAVDEKSCDPSTPVAPHAARSTTTATTTTTAAPEIDIPRCTSTPATGSRGSRDCSARPAVDIFAIVPAPHALPPTTTTTLSDSSDSGSGSGPGMSRASSLSSWDSDAESSTVVTPEGTTSPSESCAPRTAVVSDPGCGSGKACERFAAIAEIDWRKGSTAQLLIEQYRMKGALVS